jgi:cytochrome c-type biogenesis protein CcmF
MANFGTLILLATMVVAVFSVSVSVLGARRQDRRLVASGIHAAYGVAALMLLASATLIHAFVAGDYSIKYVQHYSDATMPLAYKITAYWGGLDGSLMFWVLILTSFSAVAIWRNRNRHRELIPYVVATCMAACVFFVAMLVFVKNPFETFASATHPIEGKGLNPLLQNYWMQFHPPSLYTGFVSATIPFAFGLSALITGNLDDSWLRSVRVWAMISWFFLSMGLTLGSMWAYEVLGWGGYWAWDPVENAALLPWLTGTAFLHSIMIQERRGMLKVWNVVLVITTFLLTIFGTTMTRSGIVQSVHAFGQDNVLLTWFMVFLGAVSLVSLGLIIYRLPLLRSRSELESWVSREFAFVINNWILLFAAFFVLVATMFPTISEWVTGQRVTVGPPFFNQWMVPIGIILLALTGVGPLIAWRRATKENLKQQFAWPGLAFALMAGGLYAAGVRTEWAALVCWAFCAFVLTSITQEFWRGTRVRQRTTKLDFFTALVGLVGRSKRRYGGYLVHVAVVMLCLGWAGNAYNKEAEATLAPGQAMSIANFQIRFDKLDVTENLQKNTMAANVTVTDRGKPVSVHVMPGQERYKKGEENVTIPSITRFAVGDLYVTLAGVDSQSGVVNLKAHWNPLVSWYWLGFMMLAAGTVICLAPDRAYAYAAARRGVAAAATAGAFLLMFLGGARAVHAQMPTGNQHIQTQGLSQKPPVTPLEKSIFREIGCTCPGCNHEPLSSCTCGTADSMRDKIRAMLAAGQTKDQIIKAHVDQYGEKILTSPKNPLVWAVPYAAGLGALALVFGLARRWTRRGNATVAAPAEGAAQARDETNTTYEDQLDDELRELD